MRYPSDKTRVTEQRGTGVGANYKPYIQGRDFNSSGTCELVHDWVTGRAVELLSQGEAMYWYLLRFDPDVEDIREQYPLNTEHSLALADSLGLRHPSSRTHVMTTDFLITYKDGHLEAHSFKTSQKVLNKDRVKERLFLEQQYWEGLNIPFRLVFKDELNTTHVQNIRICSYYADKGTVIDEISCLKYMIIHHLITIDTFETEPLNIATELEIHKEEVNNLWKTLVSA